MRTIITVNESQSKRGSYTYSVKRVNGVQRDMSAGYGASSAAAKVVDVAMGCDEYLILGSDDVLKLIPVEFGGKLK